MKKIVYILTALSLAIICLISCEKKPEYSFNIVADERVSGDGYDRDVKIVELVSTSKHTDEINRMISERSYLCYKDFITSAPTDFARISIDSVYYEQDGVLCILSWQDYAMTAPHERFVQSAFFNLETDELYTAEEYAARIGIDVEKVKQVCFEQLSELDGATRTDFAVEGILRLDGRPIVITKVVVESPEYVAPLYLTYLYDAEKDVLKYATSDIESFDDMIELLQ